MNETLLTSVLFVLFVGVVLAHVAEVVRLAIPHSDPDEFVVRVEFSLFDFREYIIHEALEQLANQEITFSTSFSSKAQVSVNFRPLSLAKA